MTRLWCHKLDAAFVTLLTTLGPLACFEGLLSYYGNEIDMWGDMSVAIEDLRTVLFILVRSPSPAIEPHPAPRVGGTRNALTVSLPVPDTLYSLIPSRQTVSFHVTPVFFNIGINEMATIAESIGATKPQERSNIDNFERLNEYYLRYKKLSFPESNVGSVRITACSQPIRSHYELIEELRMTVHSSHPKNVQILHLVSQICRQLKGEFIIKSTLWIIFIGVAGRKYRSSKPILVRVYSRFLVRVHPRRLQFGIMFLFHVEKMYE